MLNKKFNVRNSVVGVFIVLIAVAIFFTAKDQKAVRDRASEAELKDGTPYMSVAARVQEDRTSMDIKLLKNSVCLTGREHWEKGDVIRLKVATDADTVLGVGIIPAENMEDGFGYDDYGAPIFREVDLKESVLEFIVPETAEYGIFIQDFYSKFFKKVYLSDLKKDLNVVNIQLEVNKAFKNPLNEN